MNRRIIFAVLIVAALVFSQSLLAADLPRTESQKIKSQKLVVQVSDRDPAVWNLALNNAKNVQADLGKDKVEIEIVVYGPAIGMLKLESPAGNGVAEALANGVKVLACVNTMNGQHLTKDDMLAKIGYVPAGVVEIMQKQREGWAYIRP